MDDFSETLLHYFFLFDLKALKGHFEINLPLVLSKTKQNDFKVNLQYHFVIIDIKDLTFRRLLVDMIDGEDALSFQRKI